MRAPAVLHQLRRLGLIDDITEGVVNHLRKLWGYAWKMDWAGLNPSLRHLGEKQGVSHQKIGRRLDALALLVEAWDWIARGKPSADPDQRQANNYSYPKLIGHLRRLLASHGVADRATNVEYPIAGVRPQASVPSGRFGVVALSDEEHAAIWSHDAWLNRRLRRLGVYLCWRTRIRALPLVADRLVRRFDIPGRAPLERDERRGWRGDRTPGPTD